MDNTEKIVNRFGNYQIIQFLFACLPAVFNSMSNVNFVFVAGDLNYRCRVPECETDNQYSPSWWPTSVIDSCSRPLFNMSANGCISDNYLGKTEQCADWIYETNNTIIAVTTLVHREQGRLEKNWLSIQTTREKAFGFSSYFMQLELDLACQPIKSNSIGTVHNVGIAISMLLGGWICDWIGRKMTLILCSTSISLGLFKTLTSSYYVYISLEFLECIMSGGAITAGLLLMIETGGKNKRVLSGVLFAYSIYLGEVIFACIAMAVPYWKTLIYITYSPPILFLLYIPFTNESIRWLIVNNKLEKAKKTLVTIIKMNKIDINPQYIDKMDLNQLKVECDVETQEEKERFLDAIKCKEILKRLVVAIFCRFTACFTYYGLTFNSVMLPGNKYTNFLLSALMSFPGDFLCMYLMNRFGRKPPLMYGYGITCVSCILFSVFSEDLYWLKITFYMISKVLIAACYTGVVTYIMELFPTSVRGSLLGLCIIVASIGNTMAPLTPALISINPILTSCCFGVPCLISSFLLLLTPETRSMELTDTIKQLLEATDKSKNDRRHGRENCAFDTV